MHRAHDLKDSLGGCNPYIIIDWGPLGRLSTVPLVNTTDPAYNTTLHFGNRESLHVSYPDKGEIWPPIDISVYQRNISISDELIGRGHMPTLKVFSGFHKINLYDEYGEDAGYVVLEINLK